MITGFLISTIVVVVAITFAALRKRRERIALSLLIFAFTLLALVIAFTFSVNTSFPGRLFWLGPFYLSTALASTALLTFTFLFTSHKRWINWQSISLLAIEPVVVQILFWIIYRQESISAQENISAAVRAIPLQSINEAYCNSLAFISTILLVQTFDHKPKQYSSQTFIILIGLFIPLLIKIINSFVIFPILEISPVPLGYTITGVFIAYSILRYKFPDLDLIARDIVVENMTEGWMILDTQNRIVDLNPAAEALTGSYREKVFGQSAEEILKNWPNLDQERALNREQEVEGRVNLNGEWRYLNVRISPLDDQNNQNIGKVILWRDITHRKKSTEARLRARDEMFTLLHSISGAASRSMNLNDFLEESIYQIVYSFRSQASAIFLLANDNYDTDKEDYYLASHHGISQEEVDFLSSAPEMTKVLKQIRESLKPFSLSNLSSNKDVPELFLKSNLKSVLIVPMIHEDRVLGMVCLGRREDTPHKADEISRLSVIAEEIAEQITRNRERQKVIALEERQRVVKDLHDSITQKLYALVAQTEAAQAGLESGAITQPAEVLARIGEHARHALKEMRLFLFEMRPVDLEREGLVAVLHQRLAAVEGIADIQARLISDEKIVLSIDKQVALYYIAQEALNNILKHAKAKIVNIHLLKKKGNVVLEIQDDGCGFSPKVAKSKGGMGLGTMRERAAKVNGKLRIVSTPGQGTKVIVTVHKDK